MLLECASPPGTVIVSPPRGPRKRRPRRAVEQYSAARETTLRHTRGASLGCMAHLLQGQSEGRAPGKENGEGRGSEGSIRASGPGPDS
jgi:hypothetical protein